MFPVEIWEKILKEVDASSLTCLRTVSRTWNDIIGRILEVKVLDVLHDIIEFDNFQEIYPNIFELFQESDAWCRQCEKKIPQKYWFILLENSFYSSKLYKRTNSDYQSERKQSKLWMTMYRAWIKWKNVQDFNVFTTDEFTPIPDHRLPSERLTCCSVLGLYSK